MRGTGRKGEFRARPPRSNHNAHEYVGLVPAAGGVALEVDVRGGAVLLLESRANDLDGLGEGGSERRNAVAGQRGGLARVLSEIEDLLGPLPRIDVPARDVLCVRGPNGEE